MSPKDENTTCIPNSSAVEDIFPGRYGVTLQEYIFCFYFGMYYQIYHPLTLVSCITGLVTNSLNAAILTRPAMKNPLNFLLTTLAISDIGFVLERSCWSIAYYIYPTRTDYATAYSAMCLNGLCFIDCSCMFTSECLNVTIGVWRVVAVTWPLRAKHWCSMRRAKIVVISIAVSSIIINLPYRVMLETGTYTLNGTSVTVIFSRHVNNKLISVQLYIGFRALTAALPTLVAIGITIYLIRNMYIAYKKRQKMSVTSVEDMYVINRTTVLLTIILVIFICTNTPSSMQYSSYYATVVQAASFRNIILFLQTLDKFTTFLIYYSMSSKFRKTCRNLFFNENIS